MGGRSIRCEDSSESEMFVDIQCHNHVALLSTSRIRFNYSHFYPGEISRLGLTGGFLSSLSLSPSAILTKSELTGTCLSIRQQDRFGFDF